MLQLVLHHDYSQGQASDISGYGNYGHMIDCGLSTGKTAGTQALDFNGTSSRVFVLASDSLTGLEALRLSATIWLSDFAQRRNIIEGFLSFALFIEDDGSLQAKLYDGTRWDGMSSPLGITPLRRWCVIDFVYDGVDTAALYINKCRVAVDYRRHCKVQSVEWPFGVNVGAWPDGDNFTFAGKIAEVQVWRERPRTA